ncbi:GL18635 [Drosophila persimilis]|uniref:GL18635 n=1 Tax=Drosophila persimilis TaxID=7234 RepID=B4G9K1_DROPE|nr:splicing factor, arginine/serine-rich 15 [Drosophila persimilis]EDW29031.1 GL18635 [Drosophila persimilis]
MSKNDVTEEDSGQKRSKNNENDDAADFDASKSLTMSFLDWKKCKEALRPDATQRNNSSGRKQWSQNDNRNFNSGNVNQWSNHQDRNNIPPLSRPPPLPLQLMSMGLGFGSNFGSGPCNGPPPPNMPNCNMGNMVMGMGGPGGPGPGPGARRNNGNIQGPLQPPPFWDDMMSPNHRPPIQPPMPKCPSLWNLVPKDKGQRQNRTNQTPNKKYKLNSNSKNVAKDTYLMPPPPPPPPPPPSDGDTNSNANVNKDASTSNGGQPTKKKRSGAFIQINGQWIQKPEAPLPLEDSPPGTKEDRQRQWKEYRQAMKPFKNREFHNWKRTVQRLGKLPREELDEQQLERLQKAEEYIGAHKAMLTIKHAERWVQQDNQKSNDSDKTQVYVRRQGTPSFWDKSKQRQGQASNGFQPGQQLDSEPKKPFVATGRAIKGGFPMDSQSQVQSQPQTMPMGQYNSQHQQRENNYNSGSAISSSNSFGMVSNTSRPNSSYYSNYSNSFVKGDMVLPP